MSNAAGSTHSPSSWHERLPLVILALFGLAISTYLAMYQFGIISGPWDPVFGSASSQRALHSFISRVLPVPDATLGVLGYLAEAILGAAGNEERWRTRPWLVVLYGLLVLGMGVVSIGLVLTQAFVVRAWCALCLLSAATSIAILLLATREVFPTLQLLDRERQHGYSLWSALRGPTPRDSTSSP